MTSPRGKLGALACHPTKEVNQAEELTYLSTNIGVCMGRIAQGTLTEGDGSVQLTSVYTN
jgi:hypothetical protein